jgi:predicted PurR-regulated permease PerM
MTDHRMTDSLLPYVRRTAVITATALLLIVLVVGAGYVFQMLLLVFAGILFALFLRSITDFIQRQTGWREGLALTLAVGLFLASTVGLFWLLAPQVASQADQLSASLPQSYEHLTADLKNYEWGKWLVQHAPPAEQMLPPRDELVQRATGIFSNVISALGGLIIIFFIGLYLAAQPKLYQNGLVRLVPIHARQRARQVLARLNTALRWWLLGKLAAMLFIGVLVWLGLLLLGLPFALTLGVIAALLTFIPNFGPIISAVPAIMIGFLDSPMTAVWVVALFIAIQGVESYLLTPMIQQSVLNLPAALTITAQIILGLVAGGLGLALATPLVLVLMILVQMLYIGDFLGDSPNDEWSKAA